MKTSPIVGVGLGTATPALSIPLIRDAAPHVDKLRACGAYPVRESRWWGVDRSSLYKVMNGYYKRSRPFISGEADFNSGLNFFFSNETDYPSAIDSIHGAGGASIGVGRSVPISYAAWQNAAHAYVIDKKFMIPMGFVPVYGSLLCMAKNRAEMVSLMTGRPVDRQADCSEDPPERVCERVMSGSFDPGFAGAVVSTLAGVVAGNSNMLRTSNVKVALREWRSKLEKTFSQKKRWNIEEDCPASVLTNRDAQGRGGVLSSELAFRQERELFLQGRITGIAQDMITGGLDAIVSDMGARGLALGAIYISNVEDVLLFNYLFDEKRVAERDRPAKVQRYYDFYKGLNGLADAKDALIISAKKRKVTSVDVVARYVRRSIPLELDVDSATSAAKDFYRMRVDVALLKRLPLAERIDLLAKSLMSGPRFDAGMAVARSIFEGVPMDRDLINQRLRQEFGRLGLGRQAWWDEMFLSNLEELGVVA